MADYTDVLHAEGDVDILPDRDDDYFGQAAEPIPADALAPLINAFTPPAGSISPSQSIVIEVEDGEKLNDSAAIHVTAYYPILGLSEAVYDGIGFLNDYTGSEVETSAPPNHVIELTVSRTGGWLASPLHLIVQLFDDAGNYISDTEIYTVAPDPTVIPDSTAPVVSNYSPTPGTTINPTDAITFDVTDNSGNFTRIMVVVWFRETGVQEVIHDGDGFTGYYTSASSRVIISGGYRYAVARFGGWEYSPTIRVFPIDAAGNEL